MLGGCWWLLSVDNGQQPRHSWKSLETWKWILHTFPGWSTFNSQWLRTDIVLNLELSDDRAKFPSLFLPTPKTTPHTSHEKNPFTLIVSIPIADPCWMKNQFMEGSNYKPTVYKRKPLCVSIFWYHICHTGSHWHCLIPQPTSYWPLPYMLLCCITYGTCDTCCTLYFIGTTFYI